MCADSHRRWEWPEIPPDAKEKNFRDMLRAWIRIEDACGSKAMQRRGQNREWTPDQKIWVGNEGVSRCIHKRNCDKNRKQQWAIGSVSFQNVADFGYGVSFLCESPEHKDTDILNCLTPPPTRCGGVWQNPPLQLNESLMTTRLIFLWVFAII